MSRPFTRPVSRLSVLLAGPLSAVATVSPALAAHRTLCPQHPCRVSISAGDVRDPNPSP